MKAKIIGLVTVALVIGTGVFGDIVKFPLNCAGTYDINTPAWTSNFDLGVTFSEISHVYIDWSGEMTAGLDEYKGNQRVQKVGFDAELLGAYPNIQIARILGGVSTYPEPEEFDEITEFWVWEPGIWDNLLDGNDTIKIDFLSFAGGPGSNVISYGLGVLNDATLVVEGIVIPESNEYEITQITFEPSYESQPAWSPDGSKIAFVSDRDGNKEIYVMDANGSGQQRLTYNSCDDIEPDWSPDGSKIVFSSNNSGNYDVWIMDVDGNNPARLTWEGYDEMAPAWRYNEYKILYYDPYWNGTIYIMNVDGSGQTALSTGLYPSWSSDGTKIVYSPGIRVMNPDGSGQATLSRGGMEPAWSPYSNKIVFSIKKPDFTPDNWTYFPDLYIINGDGSNLERLTFDELEYNLSLGILRRRPTWAPDGTKIAYHYRGNIWVMSGLPTLNADILHDGIVNLRDIAILANYWLRDETSVNIAGDDVIDFNDLAKLSEEWLQTEPWYKP